MKNKRKNPIPILLLWSKKEQLRFCDAVERLVSVSRDLVDEVKQFRDEREAAQRKYERRKAARNCSPAAGELPAAALTIDAQEDPGPAQQGGGE